MLKYKAYMNRSELNPYSLEQKLTGPGEEIGGLELEWETVRKENARLQNIAENHKYTEKIRHGKNEL